MRNESNSLRESLILLVTEKMMENGMKKKYPNITRQFDDNNPILIVDKIIKDSEKVVQTL